MLLEKSLKVDRELTINWIMECLRICNAN